MHQGFFLLFATVSVVTALTLVLARNPVHSALALMACFLQISAIFVMLGAPLLAVIQIFVYVGAIMVALALLLLLGTEMVVLVLWSDRFIESPPVAERGGDAIRDLSKTLFSDYLLPFEIASVILLAALVGAIVLARKEPG
ncbi:NADH-quinone oxidoreductase subunit J [Sinorhizobium medicae]|nr:NADH-quinone oxidoreductase subunit J [Sinorhizobium medicae]